MSIPKPTFSRYIKEFKLKELFNELGWDNANVKYPKKVDEKIYSLTGIAQKKDFLILLCEHQDGGPIPDSAARKKIDNAITKLHYEHLIIYIDGKKTRQRWELMVREQNKPIVCRPIDYYTGQEPELLFQKLEGLFFAYEDEEKLSIVDVRSRVMQNFEKNAEVVTKKFYERFQKEHEKFLNFIEGIQSKVDHEWYASLMLNRLMFIYFIQKKCFLDHDKDYLRNRLDAVQQKKGKNKFYSFYRNFLLVLFHKGLGSPVRDPELEAEIGKVPHLNGGLFDVHQLEHENKDISIEDKAFERLFDFFDEYNWHLDTRITATGKDINPDVIGYIFEKYINDRAAMGAYYTKEDITEYISKNCIVPWLFDEVKRNYAKPFVGRDSISTKGGDLESRPTNIWAFLKASGDKYIYPAVKHGIPPKDEARRAGKPDSTEKDGFSDLPPDVQAGLDPTTPDLVEKRKCWNRPAPSDIALPTEIYREVIARRKRYYEVRKKIQQGEITEINDFITYNLDIRQFAQDVLTETDDPKLIMEFYKAVRKITVLDPTCGSGAFLFAALNVLESLYFTCVTRMRQFVEEHAKGKHKFFEDELKLIDSDDHPSEEYFIYKSIILHNLYGVDIMKEAVEIAKLRLFLKLVATCDVDYAKPNLGLEPLPDIDFNIRSGNTLVGYATLSDLDKGEQGGLFGDEEKQAILEEADVVSRAYTRFKDAQLVIHSDPKSYKDAKDELNNRLTALNGKLNKHLAVTYLDPSHSKKAYDAWLSSHQPFHWLAEYYTTIAQGGFDVIIGNPPYVEYSKVSDGYTIRDYSTTNCGNLYAYTLERSFQIQSKVGRFAMIVPISLPSSERMGSLRALVLEKNRFLWLGNFAIRPQPLFAEIMQRNTIILSDLTSRPGNNQKPSVFSTSYMRWTAVERPFLFGRLSYQDVSSYLNESWLIPKIGNSIGENLLVSISSNSRAKINSLVTKPTQAVYFHDSGESYWTKALLEKPIAYRNGKRVEPTQWFKMMVSKSDTLFVWLLLNSNLFYWLWTVQTDCRHMTKGFIESLFVPENRSINTDISDKLSKAYKDNTILFEKRPGYKSPEIKVQNFKPIIDEIDKVLAKHYGFTEEELDFIINYDIKYRMGKELEGESEK